MKLSNLKKLADSNAHTDATWDIMLDVVSQDPDGYDRPTLDWMYIDSLYWMLWPR